MSLLLQAVVFLAAATLVVPLSKRLGFGSVIGYLAAGILVGPAGFGLFEDVDAILHFAEIGVVMLLFVIGLELQPARLRVLRKSVFGLGLAQVLITGVVLTLIAQYMLRDFAAALVIGFGLSLSSTAFVLQMLAEKKDLRSPSGRAAFGVLLFQDLAVIPLIALVPYLGSGGDLAAGDGPGPLLGLAMAVGVLAVFVVGGRYLLRPLLRLVAATQIQEIFTAAALLLVLGSAALMESLHLSMGLGAFLAGVLVADSEYSFQLESDIQPFKGLLLGLFFVAVGMSANLGLLLTEPLTILAITAALMLIKALLLVPMGRLHGLTTANSIKLGVILGQGGEFAFVLFTLAIAAGVLEGALVERLILAVTLSMALTPLLYLVNSATSAKLTEPPEQRPFDKVESDDHDVVIAGFGRFGQIIARILQMKSISFTALESNTEQIDFVRRFGNKIYYGDATKLDLLRGAHVDKAKVFVLAVDDVEVSMKIARLVRQHFPNLAIYARARNRQHEFALRDLGVDGVIRDTLLSSIELTRGILEQLGIPPDNAVRATQLFRKHDEETLLRQHAIHHDEEALVQTARESAEQLRRLFETDRKARGGD